MLHALRRAQSSLRALPLRKVLVWAGIGTALTAWIALYRIGKRARLRQAATAAAAREAAWPLASCRCLSTESTQHPLMSLVWTGKIQGAICSSRSAFQALFRPVWAC